MSVAASSGGMSRAGKKPYATVPKASRSQWLSVKPELQIGTAFAPGSLSATNDSTACQSGVSSAERVPPWASTHSSSYCDVAAEHRADHRLDVVRVLAGQEAAVDGDLADRRDHVALPRGGDHRRRERRREQRLDELGGDRPGDRAPLDRVRRGRHLAEDGAQERLDLRLQLRLGPERGDPLDRRAAFTSALSAIPGIDACPERPRTRITNGALIFSAVEQR